MQLRCRIRSPGKTSSDGHNDYFIMMPFTLMVYLISLEMRRISDSKHVFPAKACTVYCVWGGGGVLRGGWFHVYIVKYTQFQSPSLVSMSARVKESTFHPLLLFF